MSETLACMQFPFFLVLLTMIFIFYKKNAAMSAETAEMPNFKDVEDDDSSSATVSSSSHVTSLHAEVSAQMV